MNKKLTIAIIGSRGYPYVYSGYETFVKELSERLVNKGHRVRVYCHRNLYKHRPKNINDIELIYTPSIKSKFFSQPYNSFFSFLHVCFSKADIVLVVNSANGPFGILTKLFNKKTCINVDGMEWLRPKWKGLGSIYFKIASRFATLLYDIVITDSIEMKKAYIREFNTYSHVIAYGPTMLNHRLNNSILKANNIFKNQYYLIVGRMIPDNNSLLLINGFIRSKSEKKLLIVGDFPYNDNYAKEVKMIASRNVIFTGYIKCQKQLTALYQNCYGYIHGHEFGGTNPTMINALYLNKEILSLETLFNREMLKNKKAVFFKKNEKSIAESITFFELNKLDISNENVNYKFPKKYHWDNITIQYLELFKLI